MDSKWKTIRRVEEVYRDSGLQAVYQKYLKENWTECREIIYDICEMLIKQLKLSPRDVEEYVLDKIDDKYVFYKMHVEDYAKWVSIGINCQPYWGKKQEYQIDMLDTRK